MLENTREIVLDILLELERGEIFSHKLIKGVLDKYDYLDGRDKAFMKRVAEGTIERRIELDYYLTQIYMDTAYISQFIDPQLCTEIIRKHGAGKIVFGSDSPWEDPADTLRFLQSLGLSDEELALITHKNALRLLGECEK